MSRCSPLNVNFFSHHKYIYPHESYINRRNYLLFHDHSFNRIKYGFKYTNEVFIQPLRPNDCDFESKILTYPFVRGACSQFHNNVTNECYCVDNFEQLLGLYYQRNTFTLRGKQDVSFWLLFSIIFYLKLEISMIIPLGFL